jgi:hypothetical protein
MEDDLNFRIWKTTSIFQEIEDDVNFRIWKTTSTFQEMKYQLIPNISELFLLANVGFKFQIKNNFQLNQSQPSLTWAWNSSAQLVQIVCLKELKGWILHKIKLCHLHSSRCCQCQHHPDDMRCPLSLAVLLDVGAKEAGHESPQGAHL